MARGISMVEWQAGPSGTAREGGRVQCAVQACASWVWRRLATLQRPIARRSQHDGEEEGEKKGEARLIRQHRWVIGR
jgi:hypothetical protein